MQQSVDQSHPRPLQRVLYHAPGQAQQRRRRQMRCLTQISILLPVVSQLTRYQALAVQGHGCHGQLPVISCSSACHQHHQTKQRGKVPRGQEVQDAKRLVIAGSKIPLTVRLRWNLTTSRKSLISERPRGSLSTFSADHKKPVLR